MPSFIKGLVNKKIIGKGKPLQVLKPRQCCKVCGLLFDKALMPADQEQTIVQSLCETCGPLLKAGYIAFVYGSDYAIVKTDKFPEWNGKIVHTHETEMQGIKKLFGELKHRVNGAHRDESNTTK